MCITRPNAIIPLQDIFSAPDVRTTEADVTEDVDNVAEGTVATEVVGLTTIIE